MEQTLSTQKDDSLRQAWWQLYQTGKYELAVNVSNADKLMLLQTVYNGLYSELRDAHSRQQQAISWGFAILTGGGFIMLVLSPVVTFEGSVALGIALLSLTFALSRTVNFMSEDRMSIARQLDRIHQVMGMFTKDAYIQGSTLFDPIWYGWGFDKQHDVNWRLNRIYQVVLWVLCVMDILILVIKSKPF